MPQTSPERAARWPGGDAEAIAFLNHRGYVLEHDGTWRMKKVGEADDREMDAIAYLIEEWDFGGLN